ncbi:MAG TPA: iron-containing redox enzyme family protein, partial [Polyangiaceae bacterium]|nr:iron-containing redox enzyme family protein [Polyangiaceae bacterium]
MRFKDTLVPSTTWGPEALHQCLANSHAARFAPRIDDPNWEQTIRDEVTCRRLERDLVERERSAIADEIRRVPSDAEGFVAWFEALKATGPGQGDSLFQFLAEHASYEQMCWFLRQEMAGEAGFDDLVALSQLKLPARPKLEMARNYWDEMGQGHEGGMHGPLLGALGATLPESDVTPVWETLALGNLMVALASSRSYAYQSIGALGVIELTAPGRAELVNAGLKRLHFDGAARRYYALHATLDVRHSQTWNREVLAPLVDADPRVAPLLAEGALMRLRAGARCFVRY